MVVERQPAALSGASRGELLAIQTFYFQAAPQALCGRIVPTFPIATHRAAHTVAGQSGLELAAAMLAAPARVEHQPRLWMAPELSHAQFVCHRTGIRPAAAGKRSRLQCSGFSRWPLNV